MCVCVCVFMIGRGIITYPRNVILYFTLFILNILFLYLLYSYYYFIFFFSYVHGRFYLSLREITSKNKKPTLKLSCFSS